ncbi:MAG: DegV family EDD domain-containing protein [Sphingobacteriia bacterium]|nr:DegV family EDD domain-containing protein [Sphingobacteriia bacterium]
MIHQNKDIDFSKLDGKRFYYSFLAGSQRLFDNQLLINKINVFPVRDADTGTNLASTFHSIIDSIIPSENFSETANAVADAALIGARGNSGIIFAQFLYGFSSEFHNEQTIDINRFSSAISRGVQQAYEAISNPVEGTIITVLREWAEYIQQIKDKFDNFNHLLAESYNKAKQSLIETQEKLEVLAKAKVVDAGAKGFVVFLEGMLDFFKHGEVKKIIGVRNVLKELPLEATHDHHDITFRYCTEAMIVGENIIREKLRSKIQHLGDSLVIAGSHKKIRVHIHTDHPDVVFTKIHTFGSITYQKVDDMVMQMDIAEHRQHPIGLVTDSTCDLPQDFIEKHQIVVVPLSVHFGDTYYLDRLTIKPERFYSMITNTPQYPSTAQPSFKDFSNTYNYLSTHYDSIIGIHISEALSGTCSNSRKAAKTISNFSKKPITVINSKRLTASLGLIVMRAAEALETNINHEELVNKIESWKLKSESYVTTKTMKYLVKSGRVSAVKGLLGKLLNVKPIVIVNDEGKSELFGKPLTEKASMKMVMKMVDRKLISNKIWGYAITHANNSKTAEWYAKEMEKRTGLQPRFVNYGSPVLGVNTGPGVVALSLMFE